MNVHDIRTQLADVIKNDGVWTIEMRTWPELAATYTAQIGHAPPTLEAFKRRRVELPVTFWVNENNSIATARTLYDALSWEPGSLIRTLTALPWVEGAVVNQVGAEREGPTGFLMGSVTVTCKSTDTDDES